MNCAIGKWLRDKQNSHERGRTENGERRMENGEWKGDELVRLRQFNPDWAISLVGPSSRWH